MVLFLIDNMGSGDFFSIINLAGWMDHYYSTQQFQQLQQQHHHYQHTSYLAASSNAAETDQTIRGKALLGN